MPCLVTSYEQGMSGKTKVGEALTKMLDKRRQDRNLGLAGRRRCLAFREPEPEDVKGVKIRGGSREMDLMLPRPAARSSTMPRTRSTPRMQTGSLDAAVTSSTSLISFHLEELAKTSPRRAAGVLVHARAPANVQGDL